MENNYPKVAVFDIETAPKYPSFDTFEQEEPELANIFRKSFFDLKSDQDLETQYRFKSPLQTEFNVITAFSLCLEVNSELKIIYKKIETTEFDILNSLNKHLDRVLGLNYRIGGHNILGFDLPTIAKKTVFYRLETPEWLKRWNRAKPWETDFIVDTKKILEKITIRGGNTSMDLATAYFATGGKDSQYSDGRCAFDWWDKHTDPEWIYGFENYSKGDSIQVLELVKLFWNLI